jgi:predicted dinucleotide-binding enzyme
MTKIAILGSGRVAQTLAMGLSKAGHDLLIGRHGVALRPDWAWEGLEVTQTAEAIAWGEIVILATPGEAALAFLAPHARALEGKVLVDVGNALRRAPTGMPIGLIYPEGSLGETLQRALPATRVVKTLNTMLFMVMANPALLFRPASVFLSGNDPQAKSQVRALLADLGWEEAQIEDLGGIETARGPEAFMHFVPALMRRDGMVPFALSIAR